MKTPIRIFLLATTAALLGTPLCPIEAKAQIPILCVGEGCRGPQGPAGPPGQDGSPDTPDQVREKFFTGTACPGNDGTDVMVKVGPFCVDVYEASVWDAFTGGAQVAFPAGNGTVPCNDNGNDCTNLFARSLQGVTPQGHVTWFQAQQACANSGKRLLTSAEWQMAVAGTPDPGAADDDTTTCNTTLDAAQDPVAAGSRVACVSNHGISDAVGNLWEWVDDWDELANDCDVLGASFGDDISCVGGSPGTVSATDNLPAALIRGGGFDSNASAGVFAVIANNQPSFSAANIGFRCAR